MSTHLPDSQTTRKADKVVLLGDVMSEDHHLIQYISGVTFHETVFPALI